MSDDEDYGRLLSPKEAQIILGIPAATVRQWHHRRERTGLLPMGKDHCDRDLFYEVDLLALKLRLQVRDHTGRRTHTMRQIKQLRLQLAV